MSVFKLFSGGSDRRSAPSPQDSISKLNETLEMLEKREAYLESKINKEIEAARLNGARNKKASAAIMCLKRKKAYEQQIQTLSGARLTIETQIMAIESASTNFAALNAMQEGARAMRSMNRSMDVDSVEDVMEEIREQMEVSNEISNAIATPLGMDDVDEADLEDELEQLMEEDLKKQFREVSVPSTTLRPRETAQASSTTVATEDDEFAALGAEMGM